MVPDNGSWNQPVHSRICSDIPDLTNSVSLPYPYFHTGRYSCLTDDNIFCGSPGTVHTSVPESPPDPRRIRSHMMYPGTMYSVPLCPTHPPAKRMLPSSHYIRHHYKPDHLPRNPSYNSSLPDGRFPHADKYSGRIPHPYIHASDSGNPYHYSLPPDRQSYPDKSLHSKMYSANPSPVLQTDLLPENSLIRTARSVP